MQWAVASAAFLASAIDFVEALTIVLVVGVTDALAQFSGWRIRRSCYAHGDYRNLWRRPGPVCASGCAAPGGGHSADSFRLEMAKKAILRSSGFKALHDEEAIFEERMAAIRARGEQPEARFLPFGIALSYKAVLLEGLEVAFIVITFGSSAATTLAQKSSGIASAALGAAVAGLLVILAGALVRGPLTKMPEKTLKFVVGLMLTTFGTFWAGEGFGVDWPFADLFLLVLAALYLLFSALLVL